MYIREDMASISVSVEGVPYGGSWAEAEGGNLEADDAKARPGGMGFEVSAGGPASRDDLTVRTHMTDATAPWIPTLEDLVGNGAVRVGIAWMGTNRSPLGSGLTKRGTLKAVNVPDMGSGADVGMLELVVSCDEQSA
jgi:hypothetical protein